MILKNNCWLCKSIKNGAYQIENTRETIKLKIYKHYKGKYLIQVDGDDILYQEIVYCPICGEKLRRKLKCLILK